MFQKISTYLLGNRRANAPVACQLNDTAFLKRRNYLAGNFASAIQKVKPVSGGYAFTFKGDEETLKEVIKLIHIERQCCRFLRFHLEVSDEHHPLYLKITGPEGTQKFLQQILELS